MMWMGQVVGLAALTLLSSVLGADILKTNGFSDCISNPTIQVNNMDIQYDKSTNTVSFDVSGSSSQEQEVVAAIVVSAYGVEVYKKSFDPCDDATKVDQLCPVPAGSFAAKGSQMIPSSYVSQIPSVAFTVPDIEGQAKLELTAKQGGASLACIESSVENGKSVDVPALSYLAAGIAAAALGLSALGSLLAAGNPGASTPSPGFGEVIGWFQGVAMNGMMSVNYPPIYRKFAKNFAFSTGLVSWDGLQTSIDSFRAKTGGNLTDNNVDYLRNSTLVYGDGSSSNTTSFAKRGWSLVIREIETSVNETTSGSTDSTDFQSTQLAHYVYGIQAYAEQLRIPKANTFMNVLLVFAILVAAIVVGILLFKVILETWSICGKFPKKLTTFRNEYWQVMARTIVNLILLLYSVWVVWCVYQFTDGDSWAAKLLAGTTLVLFTAILTFYAVRIVVLARRYKKREGDESGLYENKETWKKYKLFYENYKKGYWWLFMPALLYSFVKGFVLAAGNGHGMAQSCAILAVESLMLILLLWSRPYNLKSGNWINIIIQVVRVLSVVCVLIFVEELGIAQSTKTITGVVLIAIQSGLSALLAILIAVNAIVVCCRENPHRKRRKEAEKLARNFLPLEPTNYKGPPLRYTSGAVEHMAYEPYRGQEMPKTRLGSRREDSFDQLLTSAASMGYSKHSRSASRGTRSSLSPPPLDRQPMLPEVGPERW